jgi:hypothetical protein
MSNPNSISLPVVPPEDHPYIHDLYERHGLELNSTPDLVMAVVESLWTPDLGGIQARADASQLLAGRRIDGWELGDVPAYESAIFKPESYEGFVNAVGMLVEATVQGQSS